MSVKKVKISELPQLPNDAEAGEVFMAATDQKNNKTYRVPLTRYDNALQDANEAIKAAGNAAERANTAADNANSIVENKFASGNLPGIVASAGYNYKLPLIELDEKFDTNSVWNEALNNGVIAYMEGKGDILSIGFNVSYILDYKLFEICIWPIMRYENYKFISFYFTGIVSVEHDDYPFLKAISNQGSVTFSLHNPLSCIVSGRMVITQYRDKIGLAYIDGINGKYVWNLLGSDYTLPIATSSILGGVKPSDTVKVAADGTATVPVASTAQAGVFKVGEGLDMKNGYLSVKAFAGSNPNESAVKMLLYSELIAYMNSAPAEEVAAVNSILRYEGKDIATNAVKFLLNFFFSVAGLNTEARPLNN